MFLIFKLFNFAFGFDDADSFLLKFLNTQSFALINLKEKEGKKKKKREKRWERKFCFFFC